MFEAPETQVVAVSDMREDRLKLVNSRYPAVEITTDYRDLLDNPEIDAIAVATPVHAHYDLALHALQSGKHVLVEKPMTSTSQQALRLIDEAERRKLVLMVDHTFVYTGAVRKIKHLVSSGSLGNIYYYDLDPHQPGTLPARRRCHLGSGRTRSRHHGLRVTVLPLRGRCKPESTM